MGFRIWAHGLRGFRRKSGRARRAFHFSRDNCLDQSDFDPPALLAMIPSSPNAAGVAEKVVGTPESHVGNAIVKGMSKIAELEFANLVVSGVNFLAMHGDGGSISVYCHEYNRFWADSNSYVRCHFYGDNPGKDFLKKISPGLKKTDLNNFGVLAQLVVVLSKYESRLPNSAEANLRIELRH